MSETLDFSNLDSKSAAESGTIMTLDDPRNGEPLVDDAGKGYFIELIGMDSAKLRSVARKINDRHITNIRKGKSADFDSELADQEKAQLYAAATRSWYVPTLDGETLECNEKNAKRLYFDPRFPWIMEKIDKEIADRQRFFKNASAS